MEKTNTKSDRSAVGRLEIQDVAALVACCSLDLEWEITLDTHIEEEPSKNKIKKQETEISKGENVKQRK